MAKCEIHKRAYYSKECPECATIRKSIGRENMSEKDKMYKTIRYVLIAFVSLLFIYAIFEFYIINRAFNAVEPSMKDLQETTKDINKMNKKLIEQMEKGFKMPNFGG